MLALPEIEVIKKNIFDLFDLPVRDQPNCFYDMCRLLSTLQHDNQEVPELVARTQQNASQLLHEVGPAGWSLSAVEKMCTLFYVFSGLKHLPDDPANTILLAGVVRRRLDFLYNNHPGDEWMHALPGDLHDKKELADQAKQFSALGFADLSKSVCALRNDSTGEKERLVWEAEGLINTVERLPVHERNDAFDDLFFGLQEFPENPKKTTLLTKLYEEKIELLTDLLPSNVPSHFSALSKQVCALPADAPKRGKLINEVRTFAERFITTEFERASGAETDKRDQQAAVLTHGFEMAERFPNYTTKMCLLDIVCTKHLESLSSLPLSKQASSFFQLSERISTHRNKKLDELIDRAQVFAKGLLTKISSLEKDDRRSSLKVLSAAVKLFPESQTRTVLLLRIDRDEARIDRDEARLKSPRTKASGNRASHVSSLK